MENNTTDNAIFAGREVIMNDAIEKIDELFGEYASEKGFEGEIDQRIIAQMKVFAALLADGVIWAATIRINDNTTAKMSLSAKGIKVERKQTRGVAL